MKCRLQSLLHFTHVLSEISRVNYVSHACDDWKGLLTAVNTEKLSHRLPCALCLASPYASSGFANLRFVWPRTFRFGRD